MYRMLLMCLVLMATPFVPHAADAGDDALFGGLSPAKRTAVKTHVFPDQKLEPEGAHAPFFTTVAPFLAPLDEALVIDLLERMAPLLFADTGEDCKEVLALLELGHQWLTGPGAAITKGSDRDLLSQLEGKPEAWHNQNYATRLQTFLGLDTEPHPAEETGVTGLAAGAVVHPAQVTLHAAPQAHTVTAKTARTGTVVEVVALDPNPPATPIAAQRTYPTMVDPGRDSGDEAA